MSEIQDHQHTWDNIKQAISDRNPDNALLQTMLKGFRLKRLEDVDNSSKKIFISVPSRVHEEWFSKNNILTELTAEAKNHIKSKKITLFVEHDESETELINQSEFSFDGFEPEVRPEPAAKRPLRASNAPVKIYKGSIMEDYVFESFIVGPNNEFAHKAAFAVAENIRKQRYQKELNPLFIHGPSGMGKTHLLQAVAHYTRIHQPQLKVFYLECQEFMRQCVNSFQNGKIAKFQESFVKDCNILLIDDVQVLKRGEFVQDEFFRVINNLINKNCQILVASDRKPAHIDGLSDRIKTRLSWGLTIDIKKPDIETRLAILEYKASLKKLNLPQEVLYYLAKVSKQSIRELEGHLTKLSYMAQMNGARITLDFAKKIVQEERENTVLTVAEIQNICCEAFEITLAQLKSKTRLKEIVSARHAAMYLCRTHLDKPLQDIGAAFGGKDHSTVINAIRQCEKKQKADVSFLNKINDLEEQIHILTSC